MPNVEAGINSHKYTDKNDKTILIGDIIYIDRGKHHAKKICEIILKDNSMCALIHLRKEHNNGWKEVKYGEVVPLLYYSLFTQNDYKLEHAEVIGHVETNRQMLTAEWANANMTVKKTEDKKNGDKPNLEALLEVYNRYKHLDDIFLLNRELNPRRQVDDEHDPFHIAAMDFWIAIKKTLGVD